MTHLFWPRDRKLFRQRSRLRGVAPAVALMALVLIALAVHRTGWS